MADCTLPEDAWKKATVVELVEDRENDLSALAICLEARLADMCKEGEDDPSASPPFMEWRLARVLSQMLGTTKHVEAVAGFLDIDYKTFRRGQGGVQA